MIHVSSEFKEIMMQRQDFKENAEVTFSDGTVLHLEEKDFSITNNSVVDSADANAVPIGAAICRNIQMELLNEDDHLEKYDFYGARIRLYLTFQLSDTIEKIEFGTFTVTAPECYGTTVVVNASDDMYKANVAYSTDLPFPATAGAVLRDACSRCSILMGTTSFLHDDFQIQTKPSGDYTFRQVIGYLAMIACGNARINRSGKLEILTYDLDFTRECHNLTEWKSLTMDTSDITITGIQTTRKVKKTEGEKETEVEETVRAGSEGYILTVSNPLVSGNEETLVSWIHEKISGVPFRRFTSDYITYPLAEFMDLAKITDWRGNSYHTFVTDVNFVFFGITTLKNSAESGMRNASKYGSEDTQTNVHLQELIEQERTDRQEAIKNLGDSLNAGSGLYATYEKQPDGSTIAYLHDKPTLKESKTVIKITAEAIGVSNDGGKNYLYGFVLDGDIIARILYAHGIDADYINTGAIIVRDAETKEIIFSVDMDTGRVVISGDIIQIGGRPIGQALEDVKDYADKNLADYADSISKDLSSLQSQVDGQVEDWYYDYEPSMQNYPASQWTTTEERRKHIGDRFFWKSKGYAYRFMEDNGIWGWILLQDTDITKAMQAAMEAQDTADGKRRTFVTTPQPPYDIGDLWTNGEDILTATVARDKGSVYVSSDWRKLNHYTDDTVANQALEEARKAHNIVMQLDNEYQGIPSDWQGNITSFPTVQTTAQVFYGQQDVSASCSYSTNKSSGITGSWNNYLRTYTVTALSTDTGWIDITANYLGIFDVTKRFNVSKNKDGKPGENGSDGVGITKITEYFAISTSSTYAPSNWYTTPQQTTETYRYLWNYERIHYSDGQSLDTEKRIIGVHGISGSNGSDGKGIRNVTNYYLATSQQNGVTTSTSGWTTTPQTMTEQKKYLWNYEIITYTDKTVYTVAPHIIGTYGDKGEDGRTYILQPDTLVIKQGANNVYTPRSVTFSSFYRDGTTASRTPYSGRFKIEESTDGTNYYQKYVSGYNESTHTHTPTSTSVKSIRCTLYASGGTNTPLDIQTIAVVRDVDNLTQEEIFNILTDNGRLQGIFMRDGMLYINGSYIKSGKVSGEYVDARNLTVTNSSGQKTLDIDSYGNVSLMVSTFSLSGKAVATEDYVSNKTAQALSEAKIYADQKTGNLLKGSDLSTESLNQYWNTSGSIMQGQSDPDGETKAVRLYGTSGDCFISARYSNNNPVKAKGQYEIRVWLKSNTSRTIVVSLNRVSYSCALTSTWKQFRFTAPVTTPNTQGYENFTIGGFASIGSGAYVYVYNPEVVHSYSPADILAMLTNNGAMDGIYMYNNQLYVKGKYIDVDDLKALNATIGGFNIGNASIANGCTGLTSKTKGVYIGTNGLRFYSSDYNGRESSFTFNTSNGSFAIVGAAIKLGDSRLSYDDGALTVKYGLHVYATRSGDFGDGSTGEIIFKGLPATSGGTHLVRESGTAIIAALSSSSKRYKDHIAMLKDAEAEKLLDIPVVWFKYKEGYLVKGDRFVDKPMPGFYAEDVYRAFPECAMVNPDTSVEDWNYRTLIPPMLKLIQNLYKEIKELKENTK